MTAVTGRAYSVGVSQVAAGPPDIPRLYEEARVALQVGLRLSGSGAVTSFAGLGLYRLISNVSQAELRAFVHDTLGPVLELPEPGRSDLLKSLVVLSSTRFNVAESARVLHYHYNTMRYRVTKLERMLGEFVDDAVGVAADRRRRGDPAHVRDIGRHAADPAIRRPPAAGYGLRLETWYGVRIAVDQGELDPPPPSDPRELAALLDVEERLGATDPYRQLGQLAHLILRKADTAADGSP